MAEPRKRADPDRVDFESREEVPLDRLFTDDFMSKHTTWAHFDEMLHEAEVAFLTDHPERKGGNVPARELLTDAFVVANTKFASFQAMARAAGIAFIQSEMSKGPERFHGMG